MYAPRFILLPDTPNEVSVRARAFCLETIKSVYGLDYNKAWHADLDSLLGKADTNLFSSLNNGAFYVLLEENGKVIATAGLYDLALAPTTFNRLKERYQDTSVAQVVRVYVDAEARGSGVGTNLVKTLEQAAQERAYRWLYLHADSDAPRTLNFWGARGFKKFGSLVYQTPTGPARIDDFDKALGETGVRA